MQQSWRHSHKWQCKMNDGSTRHGHFICSWLRPQTLTHGSQPSFFKQCYASSYIFHTNSSAFFANNISTAIHLDTQQDMHYADTLNIPDTTSSSETRTTITQQTLLPSFDHWLIVASSALFQTLPHLRPPRMNGQVLKLHVLTQTLIKSVSIQEHLVP